MPLGYLFQNPFEKNQKKTVIKTVFFQAGFYYFANPGRSRSMLESWAGGSGISVPLRIFEWDWLPSRGCGATAKAGGIAVSWSGVCVSSKCFLWPGAQEQQSWFWSKGVTCTVENPRLWAGGFPPFPGITGRAPFSTATIARG